VIDTERVAGRNVERGFTLTEVMFVVAVIAVLAAIAIPSFTKETRRTKGSTEVSAMFAEVATRLEQYKLERGAYLDVARCPGTVPSAAYNFQTTCRTGSTGWDSLRVMAPEATMRCAYSIESGTSADTLTPPAGFQNSQGAASAEPALAGSWWYLLAECDLDGQGGTNARYYQSSVDRRIQKQNEGR
jgi:type IV pilus assembly protein PilE